jgi:predicted TIM-barrel fold metal-dependent hydrolase
MSTPSAAEIRARLPHPVIDSDGHVLEFIPAVRDELEALAGREVAAAWDEVLAVWKHARGFAAERKRALGLFRMTWWGFPARNTDDRAMAILPELLHARLPELGIDYAFLYPTYGLGTLNIDVDELRRASVRAFNRHAAASTAGLRDRLCPVAMIPMHTPEEAVAELEHCVRELDFRAVLLAGHVARPVPLPDPPRTTRWIDTLGLDSPYDYDPVWAKCEELGVAPTFHSSAMGWSGRASPSNYVLNHLGNFAAAGEATCRSLFLGGVTRRFPRLRFAFLEGGVAWACQLYSDLVGTSRSAAVAASTPTIRARSTAPGCGSSSTATPRRATAATRESSTRCSTCSPSRTRTRPASTSSRAARSSARSRSGRSSPSPSSSAARRTTR